SPSAPDPANRSSTRAPGSHGLTMLIHASRTRSPVGRTVSPGGASIRRPRHRPATIRMSGAEVGEARLESRLALVLVQLEAKCDVDRRALGELVRARAHAPPQRNELASVAAQQELEAILADDARRSADRDASRDEERRGIADAAGLEVAKQCLQLRRRFVQA